MMQYMTNSYLPSTPHKVGLNTRDRFAFAYFHEPSFQAVVKPLPGYNVGQKPEEGIHYGVSLPIEQSGLNIHNPPSPGTLY